MNKRTRDRLYPLVSAQQNGEYCKICKEPGTKMTLIIEHLDNNNANNDLENLRLACQSCNILKNPRGKSKKKMSPERESAREINIESTLSAAQAKNNESEPLFRRFIYGYLLVHGGISVTDAVNGGAEYANCSQQATRRYIDKLISITGDYLLEDKVIKFKPELDPVKIAEKVKALVVSAMADKFVK